MSELKDQLDEAMRPPEKPGCLACFTAGKIEDKGDREAAFSALSSKLGLVHLSRIFKANGIQISVPAITAHRNGAHEV